MLDECWINHYDKLYTYFFKNIPIQRPPLKDDPMLDECMVA